MTYARKKNKKKFGNVKINYYLCTRFSLKLTSDCTKVDYSVKSVNWSKRIAQITNENQDSVYQH